MFKKIWKYFFAGKVDFQVDQNGLQYGAKLPLVVIDYTLNKAQGPSKVEVLPEKEPVRASYTITDISNAYLTDAMNRGHLWTPQSPTEPKASALYKLSADSERIYFYNIGHMDHEKDHPTFGKVRFLSCEAGQPYKYAFSIPSILAQTNFSVDNPKETHTFLVDGKRVATDLVNPDALGTDQFVDHVRYIPSHGNNFTQKGVFWSFNNPPSEEELDKVKKIHRKHCKFLLEQAGTKAFIKQGWLEQRIKDMQKRDKDLTFEVAKKKAYEEIQITPEHHAAAEFMKVKTDWHPVLENKRKR